MCGPSLHHPPGSNCTCCTLPNLTSPCCQAICKITILQCNELGRLLVGSYPDNNLKRCDFSLFRAVLVVPTATNACSLHLTVREMRLFGCFHTRTNEGSSAIYSGYIFPLIVSCVPTCSVISFRACVTTLEAEHGYCGGGHADNRRGGKSYCCGGCCGGKISCLSWLTSVHISLMNS